MRSVISAIIVSLSLILFVSCGSVIDFGNLVNGKSLTNKTIGFLSPSANDFAAGLVPVEAVLNGLSIDELSRVELFIGGSLKATYTIPPFTYSWDTSALSDGPVEIKVKATLKNTKVLEASVIVTVRQGIFVSTSGSDFNPGTKTLPLKTIQVAVDKAFALGVKGIYVEKGTYTPGNGLNASGCGFSISNQNINLIGGYGPDFNSRPGISDLKGNSTLLHVIYISNMINGVIDGFIIREGIANAGAWDAYGGGLYLSSSSNVVVTNTVLINNNGSYAAGAMLYSCVDSSFSLLVTNNTSSGGGGGVYLTSCTNSILYGDISYNRCSGGSQGGLEIYLCSNVAVSAVFSNNQAATTGGGISIDASTGVNFNNCSVVNSSSGSSGSGIYIDSSYNIVMNNMVVVNNLSGGGHGGGIFANLVSNITINNCTITNNYAGGHGGGMFLNFITNSSYTHIMVNSNKSGGYAGGVYIAYSSINSFQDITFSSNKSGSHGGGIYILQDTNLTMNNGSIVNNNGGLYGGGMYIQSGYISVNNFVINNNTSALRGGGIYTLSSGVSIDHSTVSHNTCPGDHSGGIFIQSCPNFQLLNSDISFNTAFGSGGLYFFNPSTIVHVFNCSLTNNAGNAYNTSIMIESVGIAGDFSISNCIIGGTNGTATGILEVAAGIANHQMMNNTFITNQLGNLYYDVSYGYVPCTASWTNINATLYTGAAVATGNTVAAQ